MMSDADVAALLSSASELEARTRRAWEREGDVPDRDSLNDVLRHIAACRGSIEKWIGRRALRAQRQSA